MMTMTTKEKRPKLKLTGMNGNAFFILGRARTVAKRAHWDDEQWEAFLKEARSGDYDHLLQTCIKHFEVI